MLKKYSNTLIIGGVLTSEHQYYDILTNLEKAGVKTCLKRFKEKTSSQIAMKFNWWDADTQYISITLHNSLKEANISYTWSSDQKGADNQGIAVCDVRQDHYSYNETYKGRYIFQEEDFKYPDVLEHLKKCVLLRQQIEDANVHLITSAHQELLFRQKYPHLTSFLLT
jgi:hypothetical protein